MSLTTAARIPTATYRLQLRKEFPFSAAADALPYLRALGISDLYCSPILFSTPGSTHGYDVNDYRRIDPELGGRDGLTALHERLRARDMGLVLDFVPNHMGINGPGLFNTWWREVLENGWHSRYARFFDIDWRGVGSTERPRVLVPILEDHYGRVLEAGKLSLTYEGGNFQVAYHDMRFPLRPRTYRALIASMQSAGAASVELDRVSHALEELPRPDAEEDSEAARLRSARFGELKRQLATIMVNDDAVQAALEATLERYKGDPRQRASFDALNDILEEQHYRLAYWKAGVHETNYRRFFAIDSLIGLRMELPEVFQECHALVSRLVEARIVTGLRIDHVDGLRQPGQYLERLQQLARADPSPGGAPLYVVVEKILEEGEPFPAEWATHGTTGYEFIAQLAGVLVDGRTERWFADTYGAFTGESAGYDDLVYEQKKIILEEMFANAVTRLGGMLADALQGDPYWRDLTRNEVTVAVRELMAAHSVYRTYRRGTGPMSPEEVRVVHDAAERAIARNRRLGAEPIELVRDVITGVYPSTRAPAGLRETLADWVLEFQQYTGAVMAKSVEDTVFYTYNRFIALNEVGGTPGKFGGTLAEFHAKNAERRRCTPHALIATATHDTKLGEDVRARLYALSEIPHEWTDWVNEWRDFNQRHKSIVEGREAPDANEEYRLYQVLIGAWPADDSDPDETFRTRIRDYLRKAVNEAKRNTTWTQPNESWLEACDRFVDAILRVDRAPDFLASFRPQAQRIAQLGMVNSLAQVVLKTTSPGVPDFYQGCELWDTSLVDPDNRRAVDFERRRGVMDAAGEWTRLLREWRTGAIKLHLTRALLAFRNQESELFQRGEYRPMEVRGRFADHIIAFARVLPDRAAIVVAPRIVSRLGAPPLGLVWDDTRVVLPAADSAHEVVTGRALSVVDGEIAVSELFSILPVAVLRFVIRPKAQ